MVTPVRRTVLTMLAGCFGALLVVGSSPAISSVAPAADTQPPSVPQGMRVAGKSRTTVILQWRAATDDVGVVGYHLYKNNARVATIAALRYTFTRSPMRHSLHARARSTRCCRELFLPARGGGLGRDERMRDGA